MKNGSPYHSKSTLDDLQMSRFTGMMPISEFIVILINFKLIDPRLASLHIFLLRPWLVPSSEIAASIADDLVPSRLKIRGSSNLSFSDVMEKCVFLCRESDVDYKIDIYRS